MGESRSKGQVRHINLKECAAANEGAYLKMYLILLLNFIVHSAVCWLQTEAGNSKSLFFYFVPVDDGQSVKASGDMTIEYV